MRAYLIRHADAGERRAAGDRSRPLSPRGLRQAVALAQRLADAPLRQVVSSPALRCVQTVVPLAAVHGLEVERDAVYHEGTAPAEALAALAARMVEGDVAACSHGDVIPGVVELCAEMGAVVDGPVGWSKASVWVLDWDGERFRRLEWIPAR